jgi:hypothetical protein
MNKTICLQPAASYTSGSSQLHDVRVIKRVYDDVKVYTKTSVESSAQIECRKREVCHPNRNGRSLFYAIVGERS